MHNCYENKQQEMSCSNESSLSQDNSSCYVGDPTQANSCRTSLNYSQKRPSPIFELSSESTAQVNKVADVKPVFITNQSIPVRQVQAVPKQLNQADQDMAVDNNFDQNEQMKPHSRLETICDSLVEESTAEGDYPTVNNSAAAIPLSDQSNQHTQENIQYYCPYDDFDAKLEAIETRVGIEEQIFVNILDNYKYFIGQLGLQTFLQIAKLATDNFTFYDPNFDQTLQNALYNVKNHTNNQQVSGRHSNLEQNHHVAETRPSFCLDEDTLTTEVQQKQVCSSLPTQVVPFPEQFLARVNQNQQQGQISQ